MKQFLIYIFSLISLSALAQVEPGAINIAGGFSISSPKPVDDRFLHSGTEGRNTMRDPFTGLFSSDISDPSNPKLYIKGAAGWVQIGGPQSFNLDQVLTTGNQSEIPIVIGNSEKTTYSSNRISYKDGEDGFTTDINYAKPINGVTLTLPAKPVNDTIATLTDIDYKINDYKKLTNDFVIAVGNVTSPTFNQVMGEFRYFTDIERKVLLNDFLPSGFAITAYLQDVVLTDEGDLIFMANNVTATVLGSNILFIRMLNPRLESNVLKWDKIECNYINIVPQRIHSLRYYRRFLYACTRTEAANANTIATRLFKINPYDFTDVKFKDLSITDFPSSRCQRIEVYKNKVYALMYIASTGGQTIVEIDNNLDSYKKLAVLNEGLYPGSLTNPFVIHDEKFYIPYLQPGFPNSTCGLVVYDLDGNFVKSNVFYSTGSARYNPHWMGVFNGKIIITPTTSGAELKIFRVDAESLVLEDQKTVTQYGTNNQGFTSDGYLIYQEEAILPLPATRNVRKIKYNNFPDDTILIANFSSSGGLDRITSESIITPKATSTTFGVTKLYTATGANTDGGVDQNTFTTTGLTRPKIVICDVADSVTITGTTSESILSSYSLPPNTLSNGKIEVYGQYFFSGTTGTKTVRYYLNTVNSLSGAVLIGTATCAAAILFTEFPRTFSLKSGTLYGYAGSYNLPVVQNSTATPPLNTTLTTSLQYYIIVTGQLGSTSDSLVQKEFDSTFKRSQ